MTMTLAELRQEIELERARLRNLFVLLGQAHQSGDESTCLLVSLEGRKTSTHIDTLVDAIHHELSPH